MFIHLVKVAGTPLWIAEIRKDGEWIARGPAESRAEARERGRRWEKETEINFLNKEVK